MHLDTPGNHKQENLTIDLNLIVRLEDTDGSQSQPFTKKVLSVVTAFDQKQRCCVLKLLQTYIYTVELHANLSPPLRVRKICLNLSVRIGLGWSDKVCESAD